jgi:hypothetical protein
MTAPASAATASGSNAFRPFAIMSALTNDIRASWSANNFCEAVVLPDPLISPRTTTTDCSGGMWFSPLDRHATSTTSMFRFV